jgi:ubiquinone/menaquinone biosynthesis C-methylase UbiE
MKEESIGAGKSSYDIVDSDRIFKELCLKEGIGFADLACGEGKYALKASRYVGDTGMVYAVDLWEGGITLLNQEVSERQIRNIRTYVSDISRYIPLENGIVDICFLATVLHDLVQVKKESGALQEIVRVMDHAGILAIVEFRKKEGPPGPPLQVRLSQEEVDNLVIPFGFSREKTFDVGKEHYMSIYSRR